MPRNTLNMIHNVVTWKVSSAYSTVLHLIMISTIFQQLLFTLITFTISMFTFPSGVVVGVGEQTALTIIL